MTAAEQSLFGNFWIYWGSRGFCPLTSISDHYVVCATIVKSILENLPPQETQHELCTINLVDSESTILIDLVIHITSQNSERCNNWTLLAFRGPGDYLFKKIRHTLLEAL